MQIRSLQRRLKALETLRTEATVDLACRFRIVDRGDALTPVFGGRWSKLERRYLTDAEVAAGPPLEVHTYDLHGVQADFVLDDAAQLLVALGGRRSGKSAGSAHKARRRMLTRPGKPGQIIAPTYPKTRIVYGYLLKALPPGWVESINHTLRLIRLWNGSTVQCLSAFRPDSVIGDSMAWVAFDESQSISDLAIDLSMPTLTEDGVQFQAWHSATQRRGAFKRRVKRFEEAGATIYRMSTLANPFISHGERSVVEIARKTMDPQRFRREIMAEDVSDEGLVYYLFDYATHARRWTDLAIDGARDITETVLAKTFGHPAKFLCGVDYGYNQQFCIVYRVANYNGRTIMHAVDEVALYRDADAYALGHALIDRGYQGAVIVDDANGQYGGSNVLNGMGFYCVHPSVNPHVLDRIDSMHSVMRSADGAVRWYVDPSCRDLIECLETQELIGGKPDKKNHRDHLPDAAGYPVDFCFPARWDAASKQVVSAA